MYTLKTDVNMRHIRVIHHRSATANYDFGSGILSQGAQVPDALPGVRKELSLRPLRSVASIKAQFSCSRFDVGRETSAKAGPSITDNVYSSNTRAFRLCVSVDTKTASGTRSLDDGLRDRHARSTAYAGAQSVPRPNIKQFCSQSAW